MARTGDFKAAGPQVPSSVVDWTWTQPGDRAAPPPSAGQPSCRFERPEASDAEEHEGRNQADRRPGGAGAGAGDPGEHRREPAPRHRQQRAAGRAAGRDGRHRRQPGRTRSSGRPSTRPPTWRAAARPGRTSWPPSGKATDAAKAAYDAGIARINPGKDSDDLKKAVAAVADRLNKLDTQRRSVDGIETETSKTIEQFVGESSTSHTLASLDTAIAQAADDPSLSRGLNTFANLNQLKTAQANQAALSTAFSALVFSPEEPYGYFPETWPTTTRAGVPCQQVPERVRGVRQLPRPPPPTSPSSRRSTTTQRAPRRSSSTVTPPPARSWPTTRSRSPTPAPCPSTT